MSHSMLREASQTTLAERRLLLDQLETLKPGANIVEIGTAQGGTTRILADFARTRGMTVTTVDVRRDEALQESLAELGVTTVCASSNTPDAYWPIDKKVDFLFVDGDHSWFGVRADWEAWRSRLRVGAVVLFHDVSPCCPGEFVYVFDRIAHGEIVDVVSQDTLTGGRFAGIAETRELTTQGKDLLTATIESQIALWPSVALSAGTSQDRRLPARMATVDERSLAVFATLGLQPVEDSNAPIVVDALFAPADSALSHDTVVVERLVREALPIRLFRDREERFFALFPDEIQGTIRAVLEGLSDERRAFLEEGGLQGRCPLLDFVDPQALKTVAHVLGSQSRAPSIVAPLAGSQRNHANAVSAKTLDSAPDLYKSTR